MKAAQLDLELTSRPTCVIDVHEKSGTVDMDWTGFTAQGVISNHVGAVIGTFGVTFPSSSPDFPTESGGFVRMTFTDVGALPYGSYPFHVRVYNADGLGFTWAKGRLVIPRELVEEIDPIDG